MNKFDTFCNLILEAYTFGATAYGNANIDKTTAEEIQKGILQPSWQYLGNKNNSLVAGFSVANNKLPHGTLVKITDKEGNPVGAQFGNKEGIFRVDDTGGKNVYNNIDFYSGSNKEMYNYFANLGNNNLTVIPLNLDPNSPEVKNLELNMAQKAESQTSPEAGDQQTPSQDQQNPMLASFTNPLKTDFSKTAALGALQNVLGFTRSAIEKTTGKKMPDIYGNTVASNKNNKTAASDTDAFLGKGKWATTDKDEKEVKDFLGEV